MVCHSYFQQQINRQNRNDSGQLKVVYCQSSGRYGLFWLSDTDEEHLMLGIFDNTDDLNRRIERFMAQPETTPAVALNHQTAYQLRHDSPLQRLPAFTGVFGTAFSGYLLKPDPEPGNESLMLFYTADYRSELLGLFSPEQALNVLTEHYDKRRQQCPLC